MEFDMVCGGVFVRVVLRVSCGDSCSSTCGGWLWA